MGNRNTLNIKQPIDFSIFGGLDNNGTVKQLEGKDAVNNALRSWLLSKEKDYIRDPQKGGFLYNWLCKPMSEDIRRSILSSIKLGVETEFTPLIIIDNLEVIADYQKRKWTVILEGFVPDFGETINFSQDFRSLI